MFLLNLVLFILRGCMVKMVKRWPLWPGEVEICPSVQPDDPGLPRRLTREFPFGFRGGLSVHSHGPRVVCFFAPQPNLVSSWTKQNPILKNQKVGLWPFGLWHSLWSVTRLCVTAHSCMHFNIGKCQ